MTELVCASAARRDSGTDTVTLSHSRVLEFCVDLINQPNFYFVIGKGKERDRLIIRDDSQHIPIIVISDVSVRLLIN